MAFLKSSKQLQSTIYPFFPQRFLELCQPVDEPLFDQNLHLALGRDGTADHTDLASLSCNGENAQ